MKKGIFLITICLFLAPGLFTGEWGTAPVGCPEAAATPGFSAKPIHPLPDWDNPADFQPRRTSGEEGDPGSRLRISFPVGLLAMLLFFLMWKLLQSQE
jgi:hypothetical protein